MNSEARAAEAMHRLLTAAGWHVYVLPERIAF